MKKNPTSKSGFTILEMVIVLMLVSILLTTIFSIIFIVVRQQLRIYRIIETRRQGDAVFNFMKEKIIRATGITNTSGASQCTASSTSYNPPDTKNFRLTSASGTYRYYLNSNNMIYNQPPSGFGSPLNSNKITVSDFTISCFLASASSTPIVQFSFTVTFNDVTPSAEEGEAKLFYQTKVKLR